MSKQAEQIGNHLAARMSEFFDAYVIVGIVAGGEQQVTVRGNNQDAHTNQVLNALLVGQITGTTPKQKK
jgi:hypothetical protein